MKELISKIEQWAEDRNIISGAKPIIIARTGQVLCSSIAGILPIRNSHQK